MMCSESSRIWRSPALVAVLAIFVVGCITAAGAQPAAHRSETAANSADNGLRQSHGHRGGHRHSHRVVDPPRILCGKDLGNELAKVCEGRGYNGIQSHSRGMKQVGAATHCCEHGCTHTDLDSYCKPAQTDLGVSESNEEVSESTTSSYEVENTAALNNQLRPNPVVQEVPRSVSISTNGQQDAETENALIRKASKHTFYVKINGLHGVNSPVTTLKGQSTIH